MGWKKQEVAAGNFVTLGDDEDSVKVFGGLLLRVEQNSLYPQKMDYVTVKKNGDLATLSGSASLARQLSPAHVGLFYKAEFLGWGKSANGKFKNIAVHLWEGDLSPEMAAWPMLAEAHQNATKTAEPAKPAPKPAAPPSFDDVPAVLLENRIDEDSDLPFSPDAGI